MKRCPSVGTNRPASHRLVRQSDGRKREPIRNDERNPSLRLKLCASSLPADSMRRHGNTVRVTPRPPHASTTPQRPFFLLWKFSGGTNDREPTFPTAILDTVVVDRIHRASRPTPRNDPPPAPPSNLTHRGHKTSRSLARHTSDTKLGSRHSPTQNLPSLLATNCNNNLANTMSIRILSLQ